jgi:hypothetical protein
MQASVSMSRSIRLNLHGYSLLNSLGYRLYVRKGTIVFDTVWATDFTRENRSVNWPISQVIAACQNLVIRLLLPIRRMRMSALGSQRL